MLLVYTIVVFVVSSVLFFTSAIRKEAQIILEDAPEMIVQRTIAGRHDLIPAAYAEKIKDIRGIQSVKPRLWGYYYHTASRANYTLMVPESYTHPEGTIEVGDGVLRSWGEDEPTELDFRAHDGSSMSFEVAATFKASTDLVTSDLILMSEPSFRSLTGMQEGFATDLSVKILNLKECRTIAEKITQILPDTRPILREEILRSYASLFDWRSGYMIVLLSGAALSFFIFSWEKATGLSTDEKIEVAVLKSLGWDTFDILIMKFWEGAVISLSAFLMGTIAAYFHVFLASAPLFEHAMKGWAVLYPAFKLYPAVSGYQLVVLFSMTVLPYTFVTIIPVWKIAVTDPDAVMRYGS